MIGHLADGSKELEVVMAWNIKRIRDRGEMI